jgi:hypothetical protein
MCVLVFNYKRLWEPQSVEPGKRGNMCVMKDLSQEWSTYWLRTAVSHYPSPLEDWSNNQCMYARVNGCMNELKVVHEVGTTEVCEVSPTKTLRGKPATAGISPGKSWKDSPWLLVLLWDKCLHLVGSQVVMELVHMHEGLVRFPAVASSNPDQRTWNVKVDRWLRSPRCPRIDSSMNYCSLCWSTVSGFVRIGS